MPEQQCLVPDRGVRLVRVLVAHAEPLIGAIVSASLADERLDVVGVCASLVELDAAAGVLRPDVVVCSSMLADGDLSQSISDLIAQGVRVLVMSDGASELHTSRLLLAGASGVLLIQDTAFSDVADAVVTVASGRTALHPNVALAVLEQWRSMRANQEVETRSQLTKRELDVLGALTRGLSNRQISKQLGIAEKTVETHKSKLYSKLGAKNQAHAVTIAAEMGLTFR